MLNISLKDAILDGLVTFITSWGTYQGFAQILRYLQIASLLDEEKFIKRFMVNICKWSNDYLLIYSLPPLVFLLSNVWWGYLYFIWLYSKLVSYFWNYIFSYFWTGLLVNLLLTLKWGNSKYSFNKHKIKFRKRISCKVYNHSILLLSSGCDLQ